MQVFLLSTTLTIQKESLVEYIAVSALTESIELDRYVFIFLLQCVNPKNKTSWEKTSNLTWKFKQLQLTKQEFNLYVHFSFLLYSANCKDCRSLAIIF